MRKLLVPPRVDGYTNERDASSEGFTDGVSIEIVRQHLSRLYTRQWGIGLERVPNRLFGILRRSAILGFTSKSLIAGKHRCRMHAPYGASGEFIVGSSGISMKLRSSY